MIHQLAVSETYEDVKRLVTHVTKAFHRRHGGDWEELLSLANLLFAEAHRDYDPRASAFTTWVWHKIWWGLLRRAHSRGKGVPLSPGDINLDLLPGRGEGRIGTLLAELSEDARLVVELVLCPPPDVRCEAACVKGRGLGGYPGKFKRALKAFLEDLGWSHQHVLATFQEVRDVLADSTF